MELQEFYEAFIKKAEAVTSKSKLKIDHFFDFLKMIHTTKRRSELQMFENTLIFNLLGQIIDGNLMNEIKEKLTLNDFKDIFKAAMIIHTQECDCNVCDYKDCSKCEKANCYNCQKEIECNKESEAVVSLTEGQFKIYCDKKCCIDKNLSS